MYVLQPSLTARMMPVNTAAARMTSSGMRRVMGGAIALPMVQPMHIMMANGQ